MFEFTYDNLIAALPNNDLSLTARSVLRLQDRRPPTFIKPTLAASDQNALTASVIVICAPAAVGKSMLASALSADARLPVLDLSVVPVATGSLRSCFSDLGPDGEVYFTSGKIAFLVDALDEGRLLSGDPGFRAFFESAAPLLAGAVGPRIVLLGRPESGDLAIQVLREAAPQASVARVTLGFFDKEGAAALVRSYADQEANDNKADCAAYLKHRAASDEVVDAYFGAIARALGLSIETLWTDAAGRALAGYAPVLAALGTLLARLDNFHVVAQTLKKKEGKQQAWVVIETVVCELLKREQAKQCKTLLDTFGDAVPGGVFDEDEQLALVAQYVCELPRIGTGKLKFQERRVQEAYSAMLEQQLPKHPFIHDKEFRNQVFGSIVLAAEIRRGAMSDDAREELGQVSRQPFLWRSFLRADNETLIDGADLGYLLDSFWSDPVRNNGAVGFKRLDDYVEVSVPGTENPLTVVVPPIVFFGQIVDTNIDLPELDVRFDGRSMKGQRLRNSWCVRR